MWNWAGGPTDLQSPGTNIDRWYRELLAAMCLGMRWKSVMVSRSETARVEACGLRLAMLCEVYFGTLSASLCVCVSLSLSLLEIRDYLDDIFQ